MPHEPALLSLFQLPTELRKQVYELLKNERYTFTEEEGPAALYLAHSKNCNDFFIRHTPALIFQERCDPFPNLAEPSVDFIFTPFIKEELILRVQRLLERSPLLDFLEEASEFSSESEIFLSESGQVQFCSLSFQAATGYSPAELRKDSSLLCSMAMAPSSDILRSTIESALREKRETESLEYPIITLSGEKKYLQCIASPFFSRSGYYYGLKLILRDITLLRKTENALHEVQDQYKNLFTKMEGGLFICEVVTDETGKAIDYIYREANPSFERHTGIKRETLLGKKATEQLPPEQHGLIRHHLNVAESGKPAELEVTFPQLNRTFREYIYRTKPGFFAVHLYDITESKKWERILEENERRLRNIIETANEGFWFIDTNQKTIDYNDALLQILGRTAQEVMGHSIFEFVDEASAAIFRDQVKKRSLGNRSRYEITLLRPDATPVDCLFNATPTFDNDGIQNGSFALITDITAINRARREAERATRSKSIFLANMSHEIRTPMNAVLGYAELLQGLIQEPEQEQYLKAIINGGKTLLNLINDVLDLSKIEEGKLKLSAKPLCLRSTLESMAEIFALRCKQKGIQLLVQIKEVPAILSLDKVRLQQILLNVIGNAVKFTQNGSVTVRATTVPENQDTTQLLLSVQDTGPGIPKEDQERIFHLFEQSDFIVDAAAGGTGLGLAITRGIVQLMGGRIELKSALGQGSTFTIIIPGIPFNENAMEHTEDKSEQLNMLSPGEGPVLIADDNEDNRTLLRLALTRLGYAPIEAVNGQDAFEKVKQYRPIAAILDLRMPVMDGNEAASLIQDTGLGIPLIAYTAADTDEIPNKSLFSYILRKPSPLSKLMKELRNSLVKPGNS